jgi:serine/threonine-protein kinase
MLAADTTIGTYRIVRQIGEGGMGAVYLAEHQLLGRKAAIKILLPELSSDDKIVRRFFNEARAATEIADPGIVQVFDFGFHTSGSAYIVMELLDGEPLDQRLKRIGHLTLLDGLRIARQMASSLAAAHAKGIVHRDLKPENIFLIPDQAVIGNERAKVLDFGIAKLLRDDASAHRTRTGTLVGTPTYMSPEQCRGSGDVDHRADIYALGALMMTILTGRPPFEGDWAGDLIAAHLREPPPRASSRIADLPPAVDDIIERCLQKAADARYASMGELGDALAAELGEPSPPAPRPSSSRLGRPASAPAALAIDPTPSAPVAQPAPRPVRRAALLAASAVGLAGLIAACFAILYVAHGERAPDAPVQPPQLVIAPSPPIVAGDAGAPSPSVLAPDAATAVAPAASPAPRPHHARPAAPTAPAADPSGVFDRSD